MTTKRPLLSGMPENNSVAQQISVRIRERGGKLGNIVQNLALADNIGEFLEAFEGIDFEVVIRLIGLVVVGVPRVKEAGAACVDVEGGGDLIQARFGEGVKANAVMGAKVVFAIAVLVKLGEKDVVGVDDDVKALHGGDVTAVIGERGAGFRRLFFQIAVEVIFGVLGRLHDGEINGAVFEANPADNVGIFVVKGLQIGRTVGVRVGEGSVGAFLGDAPPVAGGGVAFAALGEEQNGGRCHYDKGERKEEIGGTARRAALGRFRRYSVAAGLRVRAARRSGARHSVVARLRVRAAGRRRGGFQAA